MGRARTSLIWLVSAGWLWNLVAPSFISSYEPRLDANGPLLLVLGSLFVTKNRNKDDST
jgi:hypothetical protein